MSDSKDSGGKLTLGKPGRLELQKTVDSGQVRQSFSHGRTKTVKVEKKRKRTFERNESGKMQRVGDAGQAGKKPGSRDALQADGLSIAERERRMKALEGAAKVEAERQHALKEQERRAQEQRQAREEEERRREEAEAEVKRREAEEQARREAEEQARRQSTAKPQAKAAPEPAARRPPNPTRRARLLRTHRPARTTATTSRNRPRPARAANRAAVRAS